MIVPRNVIRHELIGLDVLVVHASNPACQGIRGKIVDETKNMLVIKADSMIKRVQKNASVFRLTLPCGTLVDVQGSVLVMAPEKRLNLHKRI